MYSNDMRRLQTTSKGGYPLEEEMESQETVEAHSVSTASGDGRNDVRRYTSNMLEQILGRENMTKAYKRVVANKGSHGIDGMGVDELLPYLKENWAIIKQQILAKRIGDKRVLKLIRMYLESGVMINGVKVSTEEGTPQGGPLSPLLANIMLDELDKELERRGHNFCRYA